MRDIFARHLRRDDGDDLTIRKCRAGKLRTAPGYRFLADYRLRVEDAGGTTATDLQVTVLSYLGERTHQVWERLRVAQPAAFNDRSLPVAPYAYVPELDMLVQVYPHDHRLVGLAPLLAGCPPVLLRPLLAALGPGEWRLERWRAEMVKYRPVRRATLRLSIEASTAEGEARAERQFYAKLYPDAAEADRAHGMQQMLHQQLEREGSSFVVAEPVAYVPDLQTVVQTAVPGVSLHGLVASGGDAGEALRLAALAVARLHGLGLDQGRLEGYESPRSLHNRIARLERDAAQLSAACPDLGETIAAIVARIASGLGEVALGPTHGDLKPEHILLDGERVAIIDVDFLREADPVLDVLSMARHLAKAQAAAPMALDAAAEYVFTEAYLAQSPPERRARLPLYRAMDDISDAAALLASEEPEAQAGARGFVRRAQSVI